MEIIVADKDLDGLLASALYLKHNNTNTPLYFIEDLKQFKDRQINKIVFFDIPLDKIKRVKERYNLKFSEMEIFDHHMTTDSSILEIIDSKIKLILDLKSPSTYDLVKSELGYKNCKFENQYKELIDYMLKAENEMFEEMSEKDKKFYFLYYDIINEIANPGKKDVFNLLDKMKEIYLTIDQEVSDSFIKEKVEEIKDYLKKNAYGNKYKAVVNAKEGFPTYLLPFIYKHKEYLAIKKENNNYIILYRLNNENFWKKYVKELQGGGRKLYGKERYAGVFFLREDEKDKLGELIDDFF